MQKQELQKIVPDTSAVIEGVLSKIMDDKNLDYPEIVVPEAVVCELEHQANANRGEGVRGLQELQKLQNAERNGDLSVSFTGRRPTNYDIENAKSGEIDAIIRDVAHDEDATLVTSDKIQAETAKAQGISVYYLQQESYQNKPLKIASFFDDKTMSIHIKENVVPMAKKGKPGQIELVEIGDEKFNQARIQKYIDDIMERTRQDPKTFLESYRNGSAIIQSGAYRISLAKPPFSEAYEITVVKPVNDIDLSEYDISEKLMKRINEKAEGILISGSPGAGKSTFVQALAKHYNDNLNKIVKTMESPRDLQLPDEITQYAPLDGDMENTADVLLLVRPDYTIYDELRKNKDFNIFADMRMAGVGMIGVVHATQPIDAIQRISSRVELGVIPSIVDTSIFIKDGEIKEVYETKMTVKVPSGMKEADLARPVIEIRDFETGELKHEIYTYGEQTIVMDVDLTKQIPEEEEEKSSVAKIAEKEILRKIKKIIPKSKVDVEVISPNRANIYINEKYVPKIIGKNGNRIAEIENEIGISLGVEVLEDSKTHIPTGKMINVKVVDLGKQIILDMGKANEGENFDVYVDNDYLLTATTSKKGEIKIKKGVELSDIIMDSIELGCEITAIKK